MSLTSPMQLPCCNEEMVLSYGGKLKENIMNEREREREREREEERESRGVRRVGIPYINDECSCDVLDSYASIL